MKDIKITIIGLGLIGGSLAKALKQKVGVNCIYGIDSDDNTLNEALNEKTIIKGFKSISDEIKDSDIIFLCTPIADMLKWIEKLLPIIKETCVITDVGSIKSAIIDEIEKLSVSFEFIGGHPMTGSEKSGYLQSKGYLFENAYYIITPCSKSSKQNIDLLKNLITSIGSIPLELTAKLHDTITASISHVPHVVSAALVNLVNEIDTPDNHMKKLAAGGFKGLTRISSSNPDMWRSICLNNKSYIIDILDKYINILDEFKSSLYMEASGKILDFFLNAKTFRDSMSAKTPGLIPETYELVIDVVDEPGIIGKIATILGNRNINIKNININNNRDYEGGVLTVSLPDEISLKNAQIILNQNGYNPAQVNEK
jgi:prephenate dehydrogenase